jgi:hypothetical protein
LTTPWAIAGWTHTDNSTAAADTAQRQKVRDITEVFSLAAQSFFVTVD